MATIPPNRHRGWIGDADGRALDVIGMATTEAPRTTDGDELGPARAIRRALADAGRKAFEVSHLVADQAVAGDDIGPFARTALGPHASSVICTAVESAAVLTQALACRDPHIVIVVLGAGDRTLAMCLVAAEQRDADA